MFIYLLFSKFDQYITSYFCFVPNCGTFVQKYFLSYVLFYLLPVPTMRMHCSLLCSRLLFPPKHWALSQFFINGKKGSIYEKIYKNNNNGLDSFFSVDVGLEHLVNEVNSALIGYSHYIQSYNKYHCKVCNQIFQI